MKRIVSVFLMLAMLTGVFAVSAAAEGRVILYVDFSNEEAFYQNFATSAYYIQDGLLCGYNDAKSLQTTYSDPDNGCIDNTLNTWLTYDAKANISIGEDELVSEDAARSISIVYVNDNRRYEGLVDHREYINFSYDVVAQQFTLTMLESYVGCLKDEEAQLQAPVPMEIACDGSQFFTMGMSVTKDRIRCFVNDELIFDYTNPELLIAKQINSLLLMWNENNFMMYDDITIATAGYLYPIAEDVVTEAPVDTDEGTEAVTDGGAEAPEDDDVPGDAGVEDGGNDVPPADGGNDAPADGGNDAPAADGNDGPADTVATTPAPGASTTTGDATFAVVIMMVAAIGSAIIVKKVRG